MVESRTIVNDVSFSFANTTQGMEIAITTRGREYCNYVMIQHYDGPLSTSCFARNDSKIALWFWVDNSYDTGRFIGLNTRVGKHSSPEKWIRTLGDPNQYPIPELYDVSHIVMRIVNCTLIPGETIVAFVGVTPIPHDGYCNDSLNSVWKTQSIFQLKTSEDVDSFSRLFHPYYMERIELLHPSWWGIQLGSILILGIFLLVFSRRQPLYSRGILPIIQTATQFVYLIADAPVFWASLEVVQYNCYFVWCLQYTSMLVSILMMVLHFTRFMILTNLESLKISYAFLGTQHEVRINGKFMWLKYFGRWSVNLVISIVISILFLSIYLLLPLIFHNSLNREKWYDCGEKSIIAGRWIYNIVILIVGIIGYSVLLIDLFTHFRKKKCSKFLIRDHYCYRLEVYGFTLIVFTLFVPTTIIGFTIGFGGVIGSSIRNTLFCNMLLFSCSILPLLMTIAYLFRQCLCPIAVNKRLLDSEVDTEEFRNFAEAECSTENLSCYVEIQYYKTVHINLRRLIAKRIIDLYLRGDRSPLELNITREEAMRVIDKYDRRLVDEKLFDEIEMTVAMNLSDTLSRYILTDEYIERERRKHLQTESFGQMQMNSFLEGISPRRAKTVRELINYEPDLDSQ